MGGTTSYFTFELGALRYKNEKGNMGESENALILFNRYHLCIATDDILGVASKRTRKQLGIIGILGYNRDRCCGFNDTGRRGKITYCFGDGGWIELW